MKDRATATREQLIAEIEGVEQRCMALEALNQRLRTSVSRLLSRWGQAPSDRVLVLPRR